MTCHIDNRVEISHNTMTTNKIVNAISLCDVAGVFGAFAVCVCVCMYSENIQKKQCNNIVCEVQLYTALLCAVPCIFSEHDCINNGSQ